MRRCRPTQTAQSGRPDKSPRRPARVQAQQYLSSFAPSLGNVLPILLRRLHMPMIGLAHMDDLIEEAFDFVDQTVGVYGLHHDLVKTRVAGQRDLSLMRITGRG